MGNNYAILFSFFKTSKAKIFLLVGALAICIFSQQTNAATYTWNGGTSTAWATTTNWTPNGNPGSAVGDVVIIATAGNQPVLTVALANSIASITFTPTTATSLSLTITGVTLTVTGAVTLNSSATLSTACTITGTGTLSCASVAVGSTVVPTALRTTIMTTTLANFTVSGNLTLNGIFSTFADNPTFTHTSGIVSVNGSVTTINANTTNISTYTMGASSPTLNLAGATPFTISGTGTSTTTLNGTGATVDYQGAAQTIRAVAYYNLNLSGSGVKTMTSVATIGNNFTMSGTATATAAIGMTITGAVTIGATNTFAAGALSHSVGGSWSSNGTFTANTSTITFNAASGTQTLNSGGNNFYNITHSGAGTLQLLTNNLTATNLFSHTAGSVDLNGRNLSVGDLSGSVGTITTSVAGSVTLSSGSTNGTVSFTGNILAGSGTLGVTKNGTGTWTLSGTNTYIGPTQINAGGILKVGSATALGATSNGTTIASGGALDLGGTNYSSAEPLTINGTGVSSGGAIMNSGAAATFAGLVTLGSNGTSIVGGTGTINISNTGTILGSGFGLTLGGAQGGTLASILGTGAGILTKADAGTWVLTGANTYTGTTSINAGVLNIQNAAALGDASTGTTVANLAALQVQGSIVFAAEPLTLNGNGVSSNGTLRSISGANT
jgi:autotransporter-associated beta strand protein